METSNGRKRYSPEKRAIILKQYLLEKKALSDVCDENGIHPTMYYRWLKAAVTHEKKTARKSQYFNGSCYC